MGTPLAASVLLLRLLVQAAVARGLRRDELLASLGVSPAQYEDSDATLSHDTLCDAWDEIPRRLGDGAFGLHLAESLKPGAFDLLDYVAGHSPDLGAAYRKVVRYQRLVHAAASLRIEVRGDTARITHQVPARFRVPPRHTAEFLMANLLAMGRRLTGADIVPREVEFAHAAPPSDAPHRRAFRAPVRFGRPITAVTLDAAVLDRPLVGADPALGRVLERYAEHLLASRPAGEEDFVDQVRRAMCTEMRAEAPQAGDVARRLGMSERTLSRRLRKEGHSYQSLLDSVRKEMAITRLRAPDGHPADVAFLLGFSDVSTFYRAFRRWTGTTPAEFRRSAPVAAPANPLAAVANAVSGGGA